MNDSVFDPQRFLASTTSDPGSTRLDPIPQGEYRAVIEELEWREAKITKGENAGTTRPIMRVIWKITDDDLKAQLDRTPTVRQDIWLDVDKATGQLDFGKGKNVGIGRLREALGQNMPGVAWSPGMLRGAGPALIIVSERPGDSADVIYNDVKSVGRLS
jgi:hypothetical protein